jgi:hypothetical protein
MYPDAVNWVLNPDFRVRPTTDHRREYEPGQQGQPANSSSFEFIFHDSSSMTYENILNHNM